MSEVLYPDGYATPPVMKTIDQVFARASVKMLHPEYQKRWRGLMIASGGRLGIGGAGRSSAQQQRVFLERHNKVTSGGCCQWNGGQYQLKTGMAHAAPPGLSFHEDVVHGYAAAVDAIGDLKWAALNCERYGLEQADWGGEVWHFQFTEFPRSVSSWRKQGSPQPQKWVLPGTPAPKPPTGETVNWNPTKATVDSIKDAPGVTTTVANQNNDWAMIAMLKAIQKMAGLPITGKYDQPTANVVDSKL